MGWRTIQRLTDYPGPNTSSKDKGTLHLFMGHTAWVPQPRRMKSSRPKEQPAKSKGPKVLPVFYIFILFCFNLSSCSGAMNCFESSIFYFRMLFMKAQNVYLTGSPLASSGWSRTANLLALRRLSSSVIQSPLKHAALSSGGPGSWEIYTYI